jgi:hypothetical protein
LRFLLCRHCFIDFFSCFILVVFIEFESDPTCIMYEEEGIY